MAITNLVGNTPLAKIEHFEHAPSVTVFAKLEGNNPGSSVKDRAALGMILGAEARGELKAGITLVEPTSGNTGIALAMIAATRGYAIELVMPDSATIERIRTMEAFGAKVVLTPAADSMEGAIELARDKVRAGGYLMLNQFANPDNPGAHYRTTGPEIWEATSGQITHFVSAMGTTGTIMGTSRFLKETKPTVQIVGCQPTEGSKIPGIRRWPKAYLPTIFEPERVDRIVDISQADAEAMARRLARREGIFAGISTGGAAHAAETIAGELESGLVVFIACDRGDRYLSKDLYG